MRAWAMMAILLLAGTAPADTLPAHSRPYLPPLPATAPATQPHAGTPQAAMAIFLRASRVGDLAAARDALHLTTPAQRETFDVLLAPVIARTRLFRAAESRWGGQARHALPLTEIETDIDERLAQLEQLQLHTDGNTATLLAPEAATAPEPAATAPATATAPAGDDPDLPAPDPNSPQPDPLPPLSFARTTQGWKLLPEGLFHPVDPIDLAGMKAISAAEVALAAALETQIAAGAIPTPEALLERLEEGRAAIMANALLNPEEIPATLPATAPATATAPASQPADAP